MINGSETPEGWRSNLEVPNTHSDKRTAFSDEALELVADVLANVVDARNRFARFRGVRVMPLKNGGTGSHVTFEGVSVAWVRPRANGALQLAVSDSTEESYFGDMRAAVTHIYRLVCNVAGYELDE